MVKGASLGFFAVEEEEQIAALFNLPCRQLVGEGERRQVGKTETLTQEIRAVEIPKGDILMSNRLYIGNLSYQTTEQDLRDLFAGAGQVKSATVIVDRATNRSKGFGFVEMADEVMAQEAINKFNDFTLHERKIRVDLAKPREEGAGDRDRRPRRPRQ